MPLFHAIFILFCFIAVLTGCKIENPFSSSSSEPEKILSLVEKAGPAFITSGNQPAAFRQPKITFDQQGNGIMVWTSRESFVQKDKIFYSFYDKSLGRWSKDRYFFVEQRPRQLSLSSLDSGFILLQHATDPIIYQFNVVTQQWQTIEVIDTKVTNYNLSFEEMVQNDIKPIDHIGIAKTTACSLCHHNLNEAFADLPGPPPSTTIGGGGGGGFYAGSGTLDIINRKQSGSNWIETPASLNSSSIPMSNGFAFLHTNHTETLDLSGSQSVKTLELDLYQNDTTGKLVKSDNIEIEQLINSRSNFYKTDIVAYDNMAAVVWYLRTESTIQVFSRLVDLKTGERGSRQLLAESNDNELPNFALAMNAYGVAWLSYRKIDSDTNIELSLCQVQQLQCEWNSVYQIHSADITDAQQHSIQVFNLKDRFVLTDDSTSPLWHVFDWSDNAWQKTDVSPVQQSEPTRRYESYFVSDGAIWVNEVCLYTGLSGSNCNQTTLSAYQLLPDNSVSRATIHSPEDRNTRYSMALSQDDEMIVATPSLSQDSFSGMQVFSTTDAEPTELITQIHNTSILETQIIKLGNADFIVAWRQYHGNDIYTHFRPYVSSVWQDTLALKVYDYAYSVTRDGILHIQTFENSDLMYRSFSSSSGFSDANIIEDYSGIGRHALVANDNELYSFYQKYGSNTQESQLVYRHYSSGNWSEQVPITDVTNYSTIYAFIIGDQIQIVFIDKSESLYTLYALSAKIMADAPLEWSSIILAQSPNYIYIEKLDTENSPIIQYHYSTPSHDDNSSQIQYALQYFDIAKAIWSVNLIEDNKFTSNSYFAVSENQVIAYFLQEGKLKAQQLDISSLKWSATESISEAENLGIATDFKQFGRLAVLHAYDTVSQNTNLYLADLTQKTAKFIKLDTIIKDNSWPFYYDLIKKDDNSLIYTFTRRDPAAEAQNQFIPVAQTYSKLKI